MYEVGFTGGYAKLDISGFDVHLLMGMGDVSYFVTDNLSLGVSVAGGYIADAGDMPFDGNLLGLEANARYHFPIFCRALPYVGLHAGYMRAELD
ncbi:MAG: hypothetical protein RBU25_05085, partial [Lentisphaeria bacterium]|nr:hypothetical protein [Lentisphaeria bacterium]